MILFWYLYDDYSKTFCGIFASTSNLYIALHMSYLSEHINVSEHVVVWYSIKLSIGNMGGTCLDIGALVFT